MRMTQQRKIILSELRNTTNHPTASEVYQVVRKRLPSISLGTVYRNLNRLAEQGHIKILKGSGNQSRFDGDVSTHFHLRCLSCNAMFDIHLTPGFDITDFIQDGELFDIHGYQLDVFGLCRRCQH